MKTTIHLIRMTLSGILVLATVAMIGASLAFIVPGMFGYERFAITGGSMSGTFERGSIAISEKVPAADLRVGDIITYRPPADTGVTELVTHRIVSIDDGPNGKLFRTKGDANAAADPWTFDLDAGAQPRLVATAPYLGYVVLGLADRSTRMLVIGLPAGLVMLHSLLKLLAALGGWLRPKASGRRRSALSATESSPFH